MLNILVLRKMLNVAIITPARLSFTKAWNFGHVVKEKLLILRLSWTRSAAKRLKGIYSFVTPSRVIHGLITSLLRHQWVHPDEAAEKSKQTARYDYHQTPDKIYCNVYCKGIIPKTTKVVMSSKRVDINVSTVVFYWKDVEPLEPLEPLDLQYLNPSF